MVRLVIFVAICQIRIFKVYFNLFVHLFINILAQRARNDTHNPKGKRGISY